MVQEKRFREDLYYRLDVIPLRVAPLRERLEDIEDLALFYSQRFAQKFGKKAPRLTEEVMDALKRYQWPGNVRELENAVEYMVNLMGEDGTLDVSMLPEDVRIGSQDPVVRTDPFPAGTGEKCHPAGAPPMRRPYGGQSPGCQETGHRPGDPVSEDPAV